MNRREVMAGSVAILFATRTAGAQTAARPEADLTRLDRSWAAWKDAYTTGTGRVVDGFQDNASHSESQGYGLYLAARFGDLEVFQRIRGWTEANLALRDDGLLSWRWREDSNPQVPDTNNASDGDLFYAWALAVGAERFGLPDARLRAAGIAAALEDLCLRPLPADPQALLLLPAAEGFERAEGLVFNPSYWMPRLLSDLGTWFERPNLVRAADSALRQLDLMAAQGLAPQVTRGLAPDWALATPRGWEPPPADFSANAGYEAMRVPLYLAMSGAGDHPMVARFRDAHAAADVPAGETPTVFDTRTGAMLQASGHSGYAALAGLTACAAETANAAAIPLFTTDQPYYPATLHLFVLMAQLEGYPGCPPI